MELMLASLWQVVLGLGLFLLGMNELEAGIRTAGYATVKRALYRFTSHRIGALATGVIVTGIVQSSTMVSLLILAFASAGVIPLVSAIGVLLGANLGSTFTGWLVTALGFKLNLAALAMPLLGLGALWRVFMPPRWRGHSIGVLLFGFGLLIFGLGHMKAAVTEATQQFDVSTLQGHGAWLYALAGLVIAALVHSSAAAVMIALTALNAGVIGLPEAAAMVIGADLGTTSTAILGSLRGNAIKKQLAFSHCFFNFVIDAIAFFLLLPLLPQALALAGIEDPLYGVVAFHSTINALGLLLFLPWLDRYAAWVSHLFTPVAADLALAQVPVTVPDVALHAMRKVLENVMYDVAALNLAHFGIQRERLPQLAGKGGGVNFPWKINSDPFFSEGFETAYENIKQHEEELVAMALKLQQQSLSEPQAAMLAHLLEATRLAVFAAKSLKDVRANLQALDDTSEHSVAAYYQALCRYQLLFHSEWLALVGESHQAVYVDEQIARLRSQNEVQLVAANDSAYRVADLLHRTTLNLSSLLNVNREIHLAAEHLLLLVGRWQWVLAADALGARKIGP